MSEPEEEKFVGLATLFERVQLKLYFIHYLYFVAALEIFIFLVIFLGRFGPDGGPFPWKFYFCVAFVAPVAVTFLLGICVLAFNSFIFGTKTDDTDRFHSSFQNAEGDSHSIRSKIFLNVLRQIPFLTVLFLLIIGALVLYKIDSIAQFVASTGEMALKYLFLTTVIILGGGCIIGLVLLTVNYKLRKKAMEKEYQYRRQVMETMGLLILGDDRIIDKEGRNIALIPAGRLEKNRQGDGDIPFLPSPAKDNK